MRSTKKRLRGVRRASWLAALLLVAVAHGACIIEESRCSDNQVLMNEQRTGCVCAPGAVPDPRGYGCMRCGEHEEAVEDKCECESGYIRPQDGAPCEVNAGSSRGDPCSEDAPCHAPNPHCGTWNGESYCTTQGCTTQDDCPLHWRCEQVDGVSFCAKPPTGLGMSCASQDDCAGNEANYCETFVSNSCLVQGCANGAVTCQSMNVCCDLPALLGTSLCVPATVLMNGLCPDGQAPVQP